VVFSASAKELKSIPVTSAGHGRHDACSALVTQTLLVPVGTHALATLVLVDFRFSSLLERSHDM